MLGLRSFPPSLAPVRVGLTPAPQALYLYEYIITLSDEIRYIWRHKYSFATLLFAFNRYAVWIETALQLYIVFGDLTTADVSSP